MKEERKVKMRKVLEDIRDLMIPHDHECEWCHDFVGEVMKSFEEKGVDSTVKLLLFMIDEHLWIAEK